MILSARLTANSLHTNKLNSIKIIQNGIQYSAYDITNTRILISKLRLYRELYEPANNAPIDNILKKLEDQAGEIFLLESDILDYKTESDKNKKRVIFWQKTTAGAGVIILLSIILNITIN